MAITATNTVSLTSSSTQGSSKVNSAQEINIPIGQTADENPDTKTEACVNAEYRLGMIKAKLSELKQANPAQASEIQRTFDNTTYTVSKEGVVSFSFKGPVNVEMFKKIFVNTDGLFREYLLNRHNEELNNGDVHPSYVIIDGVKNQAEDIHMLNSYGNYEDDEDTKLYLAFNRVGESLVYTDGFSESHERTWYGKPYIQNNYKGMQFDIWDEPQEVHYTFLREP